MPDAASDNRAMEKNGEFARPNKSKAIPPTNAGIAIWYRRSSLRSELPETNSIAARPTRCGIITRNPTMVLEYSREKDPTSCGIQKLTAYRPFAMVKPITARCHTLGFDKVPIAETEYFLSFSLSSLATAAVSHCFSSTVRKLASEGRLGRQR